MSEFVSQVAQPIGIKELLAIGLEVRELPLKPERGARLLARVIKSLDKQVSYPLHTAADGFIPRLSIAFRYAFAAGRKVVKRNPRNVEGAVRAIENALNEVLPKTLFAIVEAGGKVGEKVLSLRTAGGPGSGNFGHAGRPGQVGGSSKGDFHVVPQSAIPSFDREGHYPLYHFTSIESIDDIFKLEAVGETKDWDPVNMTTSLKDDSIVSWTRDPHYAVRGRGREEVIRLTVDDKQTIGETQSVVGMVANPEDRFDEIGISADFEHEEVSKGIIPLNRISEIAVSRKVYKDFERRATLYEEYAAKDQSSTYSLTYARDAALLRKILGDPRLKVGVTVRDEFDPRVRRYKTFKDLASMNLEVLRTDDPLKFNFNVKSPSVIKWVKKHAAELITDVTETSRKRIKAAVIDLLEEGDWDKATESILKAVGDEERAEMIAHHETMLAASEGQRLAWDQAVEKGLLDGFEKRTWIVTPDDKLCPECAALEGTVARLGEEYPGGYSGPPAHVGCRCTEGLI